MYFSFNLQTALKIYLKKKGCVISLKKVLILVLIFKHAVTTAKNKAHFQPAVVMVLLYKLSISGETHMNILLKVAVRHIFFYAAHTAILQFHNAHRNLFYNMNSCKKHFNITAWVTLLLKYMTTYKSAS